MKTHNYINYWTGTLLCGMALLFCSRYIQSYISPSQRWHVIDYLAYLVIIAISTALTIWQMSKRAAIIMIELLPYVKIRLILRYFLAFIFLYYGFAKLLDNQFFPLLYRSDKLVSQLNGMDKAWIFFGHSAPYKYFIGGSQVLASLLLFLRRTTLVGLLLLLPVISNIVFLNFAFNIPVKFDSCFYLVINLYLLSFYLPQTYRFILANPEPQLDHGPTDKTQKLLLTFVILTVVVVAFGLQLKAKFNDTWKTKLYGTYDIKSAYKNGAVDSASSFKTFYFDIGTLMNIKLNTGEFKWADYNIKGTDSIFFEAEKALKGTYQLKSDTVLLIKGVIGKDDIRILLNKRNKK
ncbi:MAG: hypothetical protein M3O71_06150 [Bacteroidota bacterium]|nr:hypothetical protein [Bacteroidota bacterium]